MDTIPWTGRGGAVTEPPPPPLICSPDLEAGDLMQVWCVCVCVCVCVYV